MNMIPNDSNKWCKIYDSLEDDQQFQYLMKTLDGEIQDGFFKDIDFMEYILQAFEYLNREKRFEEMSELYGKASRCKEKCSGEWYYADKFLMDYNIYMRNINGIRKHLASFLSDPAESLDAFIPIFDKLVYYGYSDLTLDISLQAYDRVKDAPGLIGGAESEFDRIIYAEKLQGIYNDLKNNIPVDKDKVVGYLDKFDFDLQSDIDRVVNILSPGYDRMPDYDEYQKDVSIFLEDLMLMFCRYMLDLKNMSFATACDIWYVALDSFKGKKSRKKSKEGFDSIFKIDKDEYDSQISSRMGLISNKYTCSYALAWGMVYVYDFLYKYKYISDKVYADAQEIIDSIKVEIITGNANSLWNYDFVHNWGKPDSIGDEEFNNEKDLFSDSFKGKIELLDNLTMEQLLNEEIGSSPGGE